MVVTVYDINDNRPVMSSTTYSGRVLEGAVPGTVVLAVTASDRDQVMKTRSARDKYPVIQDRLNDKTALTVTKTTSKGPIEMTRPAESVAKSCNKRPVEINKTCINCCKIR